MSVTILFLLLFYSLETFQNKNLGVRGEAHAEAYILETETAMGIYPR